jgi:hypothetical protein
MSNATAGHFYNYSPIFRLINCVHKHSITSLHSFVYVGKLNVKKLCKYFNVFNVKFFKRFIEPSMARYVVNAVSGFFHIGIIPQCEKISKIIEKPKKYLIFAVIYDK